MSLNVYCVFAASIALAAACGGDPELAADATPPELFPWPELSEPGPVERSTH